MRSTRRLRRSLVVLVAALAMAAGLALPSPIEAGAAGVVGRLSHDGRWLTDADGRVVLVHGVNLVSKWPAEDPQTPAEVGFGADDAAFLHDQGFNVVRLGVVFGAVMPQPGVIDQAYVDSIVGTVGVLADAGLYVLLDWHQDGYGPLVHGNGFPAWATLTDGLPNPVIDFPLYYLQNPALQRAFDNFWANAPGPDGVPLQTHYATAVATVAAAVAGQSMVLGYDTMNEPWPGTNWQPCVFGCPDQEAASLGAFAERMVTAIRAVDPDGIVFTEPFTLFNFGLSDTTLSGYGAPRSGLSFHVYAATPADDEATIDRAIAASARGDALLATEFGATTDVATLDRLTDDFDTRLVPWIFWSYDENVVLDMHQAPTGANVRQPVVTALARPYATATNGTPTAYAYDPATQTLDYRYATARPDGAAAATGLTTVLAMTPSAYPDGYTVSVQGAAVASAPGAAELELCNDPGATEVVVQVTAGADPDPPEPVACEGEPTPTSTTTTTVTTSAPTTTTSSPGAATTVAVAVTAEPQFTG